MALFWAGVAMRADEESVHEDERTSELAGIIESVVCSSTAHDGREGLLSVIEQALRQLPIVVQRNGTLRADDVDVILVNRDDNFPRIESDRVIVVLVGRGGLEYARRMSARLGSPAVVVVADS